jgi:hypothetical protein
VYTSNIIKREREIVMSVTEILVKVIDEVLDEKEREVIISFLDNADEIDFSDFWKKKNYKVIADKGLTTYWSKPITFVTYKGNWDEVNKKRINDVKTFDTGFRPVTDTTVYDRLESAMDKLEKSAKLRAINEFSA